MWEIQVHLFEDELQASGRFAPEALELPVRGAAGVEDGHRVLAPQEVREAVQREEQVEV